MKEHFRYYWPTYYPNIPLLTDGFWYRLTRHGHLLILK
jgi:hypothetical protein